MTSWSGDIVHSRDHSLGALSLTRRCNESAHPVQWYLSGVMTSRGNSVTCSRCPFRMQHVQ
ncbi:hypothetical protein DFA_05273 [Cavenderia fasciculata]|uniref:Uncharacterized protein n=1 Tax=Cavenderia fasciculata TaxID=261658 RepID=F4PNU0_CACFS|nr:uncharacterized protein DFA_05273 [Cavenderia fasciculata]EGG23143.1 hypothetical protein DFA_05273 [Cavenderia fasciculata]|eukprot:XP_004360994.1 hypothetical protein DFA_05273 [Cavenderia fasciculata]